MNLNWGIKTTFTWSSWDPQPGRCWRLPWAGPGRRGERPAREGLCSVWVCQCFFCHSPQLSPFFSFKCNWKSFFQLYLFISLIHLKLQVPSSQHSFPCPFMWTWLNSPSPSELFISSAAFSSHLPFPWFLLRLQPQRREAAQQSGPGLAGDAGETSAVRVNVAALPWACRDAAEGKRSPKPALPVLLMKSPLRCVAEEPTFLLPSQGLGDSLPPS